MKLNSSLLTILTIFVVITLLFLQYKWYQGARKMKAEFENSELSRLMPDIAIAIDSMDHNLFHHELERLDSSYVPRIKEVITDKLRSLSLKKDVEFAIYQDSTVGKFISSNKAMKSALLTSNLKHCLTCITQMAILKGLDIHERDKLSEEELASQIEKNTSITFYTPMNGVKDVSPGKIVWLTIVDQTNKNHKINYQLGILSLNIILIIIFLFIFFRLLSIFQEQKKLVNLKNEFINNTTHELKTPLSSLKLASNLLASQNDENINLEYIGIIQKESESLENKINEILKFGKIQENNLSNTFETIDVHELLFAVKERFSLLMSSKNANIDFVFKAKNNLVNGNLELITSAFENLIDNSLKYCPASVNIKIITKTIQNKLVIYIIDDGPGIDKMHHPFIFDRFYRGQNENNYLGKGFGIGLSLTKEIIEEHKGKIELNKDRVRGTEFIITL